MRYILLTGGELFNKGAQAMTFTVITEIKKMFPNKEIILLSRKDYDRDKQEKEIYNFEIMPWNMAIKAYLLGGFSKIIAFNRNKKKYNEFQHLFENFEEILRQTFMIIDISGYSLSSQNNPKSCIPYMSNIMIAKKYNIPIWLFPQSFGPFDYVGGLKGVNKYLLRKYLKYPVKIFVRENHGLKALNKCTNNKLDNVVLMPDIVLQSSSGYSADAIYNYFNVDIRAEVEGRSVAIIPNMQVVKRIGENQTLELYSNIISDLLDKNRIVYILRHSTEDLKICREIKSIYADNKNVKIIDEDYSCIELEQIMKSFDYIIASRYHSIVHAYKNKVPSIAIGWAVKYEELLNRFEQGHFNFDIRNKIDFEGIIEAIEIMDKRFEEEKLVIQKKLELIQLNDVFSYVEKYYEKNSN